MKTQKVILQLTAAALLTGALLLLAGCEKEKKTEVIKCIFCGVGNPLTELTWLKERVDSINNSWYHATISTCLYNNDQQGFLISQLNNDGMTSLLDCSGNLLCIMGGLYGLQDTTYKIYNVKIIYSK